MAEPGLKGFTTRILEYDKVEAIILRPAETVVRYGKLLQVRDRSQDGKVFLAMVVNVKEETTHPALDVERFRDLYLRVAETRLEDASRVLEELFSPQQDLIKWNSIMTVELSVLGEVTGEGLRGYDRPPRPMSEVREPSPKWLEEVIHAGLGDYEIRGVYIGRLSVEPDVRIYLNPYRFTMHLSILAQTGGGKTETVKRLVAETQWRRPFLGLKGGAIVFDVAGEYTGYPYVKPDSVPLLDAVLRPGAYGGAGEPPERLTVIVPYTLPGWRGKDRLATGIRDLAVTLKLRTELEWRAVIIDRTDFYDAIAGEELSEVKAAEALESDALILALPYPSFMSVGELRELSGSRSEYFEVIVDEVASILDLVEGDDILSVPAVFTVVKLARSADKQAAKKQQVKRTLTATLVKAQEDIYAAMAEAREKGPVFLRFIDRDDLENLLVVARLKGVEVDEVAEKVGEAVESLVALYDSRTLASIQRGLKRTVLMTSAVLDKRVFDVIVERMVEGFTIVHLAPPSMGDVDLLLGLLIRQVFQYHVGRYEPDRLTLLVVEEAHNLAPPQEERASKESLLRVAREGRKWGLSLWLVTQRPSFVDADILSQAATSILLRTTNPDDLGMIRRSVESVAAEIVDRLPELEPSRGEALVVGLAAPERRIPLLVSVERLRRAGRGG